jgi:hypothetical protein
MTAHDGARGPFTMRMLMQVRQTGTASCARRCRAMSLPGHEFPGP